MHIQLIDALVFIASFSAAVGGYRLGFVTRVLSWIGLAAGVVVAITVLPWILRMSGEVSAISRLTTVVVLMLSGALLGQMLGLFVGSHLSSNLPTGRLRRADRIVGAFAGVLGVLTALWLLLPAAANVPGWSAQQVRGSKIAQALYNNTPRPPDAMNTLRNLVGSGGFPSVFEGIAPAPDAGAIPSTITLSQDMVTTASAATIKVEGTACRRTQDGSGFFIAKGLAVTNAHVVAGEKRTSIFSPDGKKHAATVVAFDPARDLALLDVADSEQPSLNIASASVGQTGAVFGHPGGQDELAISPAAVSDQITAVGRDLYDTQTTRRDVLVLASSLKPGDSGGALVNSSGDLIGIAFAIAPDKDGVAYALATSELRELLKKPHATRVDTGDCVTG